MIGSSFRCYRSNMILDHHLCSQHSPRIEYIGTRKSVKMKIFDRCKSRFLNSFFYLSLYPLFLLCNVTFDWLLKLFSLVFFCFKSRTNIFKFDENCCKFYTCILFYKKKKTFRHKINLLVFHKLQRSLSVIFLFE